MNSPLVVFSQQLTMRVVFKLTLGGYRQSSAQFPYNILVGVSRMMKMNIDARISMFVLMRRTQTSPPQ
jgi:hypothetical protein